jgi:predicted deacetylase
LKKGFGVHLHRFIIHRFIILTVAMLLIGSLFMGEAQSVSSEDENPKFVLLRLEDIGPGGQFDTIEKLGRLRAVLNYLRDQKVPVQLAVIPRWLNFYTDGSTYDQVLDNSDSEYIAAFRKVLHEAEQGGAVIGMHGYTHQYGTDLRKDGGHETAIGSEFNVHGADDSKTIPFAKTRMNEGIQIMNKAGFAPKFWEAPHYHSTLQQDLLFRGYFGLNYHPDVHGSKVTDNVKMINKRNVMSGASSLGAVYIPTPFGYVPFSKDEHVILDKLGKTNQIASFFYHPFLEFKYLTAAADAEGKPLIRDGIPVYTYPQEAVTHLQKIIAGVRDQHYEFYSLHDCVPFTPSESLQLSKKKVNLQLGDVTGDGQADAVSWDLSSGEITVTPGSFGGIRNKQQNDERLWANIPYAKGAAYALADANGDGKKDLWIVHPSGKLETFLSTGSTFKLNQSRTFPQGELQNLFVLHRPNAAWAVVGMSADKARLVGVYLQGSSTKPLEPYLFSVPGPKLLQVIEEDGVQSLFYSKSGTSSGFKYEVDAAKLKWKSVGVQFAVPAQSGRLMLGDFNGDGKQDVLRFDRDRYTYTVYLRTDGNEYRILSRFGPWGQAGQQLRIADLDGNGKSDLFLYSPTDGILDTALSYEMKK